jgi:hypothetical protein
MLTYVPGAKARNAIDAWNITDIHQEIQIWLPGNLSQQPLGCKNVFVRNMLIHYLALFLSVLPQALGSKN